MNRILKQPGLAIIAMSLASVAVAQTNPLAEYLAIQSNAEVNAQIMLNNIRTNVEYHRLHPTLEEIEAKSNALAHSAPSPAWPQSSRKQTVLEHCAAMLRSAIDTNQIEIACSKLTNNSQAASFLREASRLAISNLDQASGLLLSTDLETFTGPAGYQAKIWESTNEFYFNFLTENGPVRTLIERTSSGCLLMDANFYKNGKLRAMVINSVNSQGQIQTDKSLFFNEDGTLSNFFSRPMNVWIPGWDRGL
jgi:hypothetical protein